MTGQINKIDIGLSSYEGMVIACLEWNYGLGWYWPKEKNCWIKAKMNNRAELLNSFMFPIVF